MTEKRGFSAFLDTPWITQVFKNQIKRYFVYKAPILFSCKRCGFECVYSCFFSVFHSVKFVLMLDIMSI